MLQKECKCNNLNAYKDSIPEGWRLLSFDDFTQFASSAQFEGMHLVKPELTGLVRKLFVISSSQLTSPYAGQGFVYVFVEVNGQLVLDAREFLGDLPGEGEYEVNICITYDF